MAEVHEGERAILHQWSRAGFGSVRGNDALLLRRMSHCVSGTRNGRTGRQVGDLHQTIGLGGQAVAALVFDAGPPGVATPFARRMKESFGVEAVTIVRAPDRATSDLPQEPVWPERVIVRTRFTFDQGDGCDAERNVGQDATRRAARQTRIEPGSRTHPRRCRPKGRSPGERLTTVSQAVDNPMCLIRVSTSVRVLADASYRTLCSSGLREAEPRPITWFEDRTTTCECEVP